MCSRRRLIRPVFIFHSFRHLKEISELQAHQRGEVELLYRRLGKVPPSGLSLSQVAPSAGRRKRSSRHRLKPGKLLSPLVQQFRHVTTKTSDSSRSGECSLGVRSRVWRSRPTPFSFHHCHRPRGARAESQRVSGQRGVPDPRQGPVLHQPPAQLRLPARPDAAALFPQGLPVV